jgi:hypothetical protein
LLKNRTAATTYFDIFTASHARGLEKYAAQGSLSSLAAFPPRRGLGGAAQENSDYLACGAKKARAAGTAAGPERGPCARGEFYSNILPTCAVGYDLSPATRARMLSR